MLNHYQSQHSGINVEVLLKKQLISNEEQNMEGTLENLKEKHHTLVENRVGGENDTSSTKTIQNQKNVLLNIKSFLKKHDTSEMDPQERRRHE